MKENSNVIIIAEDEEDHLYLIEKALSEIRDYELTIYKTNNGVELLNFIYQDNFMPDIILLDIDIPEINGFEVIKEIKKKEKYDRIPILILSTSNNEKDIQKASELGCDGYIIKPFSYGSYFNIIKDIVIEFLNKKDLPKMMITYGNK